MPAMVSRGDPSGYDGPVRLATFNVHNWADAKGRGNASRVARLLAPMQLDAIALQEVTRGGELERLAGELGMHAVTAPAGWGMNALLTRQPLSAVRAVTLDARGAEARSAVVAVMETERGAVGLCATHLAHEREATRLVQLRQVLEAMEGLPAASVLLGDLNALRPTDYAPKRWQEIERVRALGRWEAPLGDVVAALDAAGWVDLARLSEAGGLADYEARLVDPMPPERSRTCRYGTRVDYAWASRELAASVASVAVDTPVTDASDHSPVVVTLGW